MLLPILFVFSFATMGKCDLGDFFPNVKGNLTKITWAHAVNNSTLLKNALDSKIMMLEADVSIGSVGNKTNIPIMAHPPANTSDLSLEQFLGNVSEFNSKNANDPKGIKLDFKSIDAFTKSIDILKATTKNIKYPIWLNADIIPGPVNATTVPVKTDDFLHAAKNFSTSTLSIGWTTNYNSSFETNYSYTDNQIEDMLTAISRNNVTAHPITFPVRAGLAAESLSQMQMLIKTVKGSTLTIWSSEGDPVNVDNLISLILKIGVDKVYVDVPADLAKKINLGSSSNRASHLGIFSVVLSTAVMLLTSKML